ncbi:RIP metalloprotease RseP [Heliobacterium gestii]|uniref:Zinc metalloprotease n=1 Tax=Heliomicrobium gestii TaxID=2699 RepID=A0A845LFR1_HELGE|nr:RIP metalloprotease RseP [Heliomicrobium gestii]MBM7867147.1 regulator of sigma E protease [Heliomicrobium gestii]MZP43439.1 RIP metalloprotease RseP [Heliomicrobium gestii]
MTTFLASVFVFGLMIFFHELGHFSVAKMVGVRVLEFSIGMGPQLFGLRRGATLYALRLLPVGGFVRMAGMEAGEDGQFAASPSDPGNFNNKTVAQRAAVIFAGSFMNFILAFLLFIYIYTIIGVPTYSNVIGDVLAGKPAQTAGIRPGDRILAVNGKTTENWSELLQEIHPRGGQEVTLTVESQGAVRDVKVVPGLDPERNVGQIGITVDDKTVYNEKKGLFTSLKLGLVNTLAITTMILHSIFQMITGAAPAEVGGPVMIVNEIGKAAQIGLTSLLMLAAVLSINLGLLNLFPIPALDGSRLVFLGLEALRGRPIDPAKENTIHLIGFALLIGLMLLIAYKDVLKLLGGG